MNNQETFIYMGYEFQPYGKIEKGIPFENLRSHDELGLVSHLGYSHKNFYKASGNSKFDLFKCINNNRIYIPCGDRIYEYIDK